MKYVCCFIFFVVSIFANESKAAIKNDSLKIIFIGDPQRTLWMEVGREHNDFIHPLIFNAIAAEKPTSLIVLGDLTDWGSCKKEWRLFDNYTDTIRHAKIPIYPVFGNHDYFVNKAIAVQNMQARFQQFKQQPWYCFVIDSIGFIMLNSNFKELSNYEQQAQITFLDSILKVFESNSAINLIVACWHHAAFTNSKIVKSNQQAQQDFVARISKCKKTKLIANGHAHTYEHFKIGKRHFLNTGGSGGARQQLLSKKRSRYQDEFNGSNLRPFNYCILKKLQNHYQISVVGFDSNTKKWKEIDSWEIN